MHGTRGWSPSWWDGAVAVCVATAVVANSIAGLATPRVSSLATVFGLICAAILLARSRLPMTTALVIGVCSVVPTLATGEFPDFYASFVPSLAAYYAVALHCSVRQAAVVPVLGVAVLAAFALRVPGFLTPSQTVYIVAGMVLAFAAGRTMQVLRHRAELEAARADLLEREHDVQAREAVLAERERIARELHDVIAHDVAVMVVQAGAAERRLPDRSGDVGESLAQIQSSGRKAIDELHLLLGMLRDEDQALVMQPGLHAVPPLVAELVRVGLPVTLRVTGSVRDVGDALDLSAYRIVQEALTNVLKHASGSHTQVVVDYGRAELTIAVADNGDGDIDFPASGHASSGHGHGLVGMRERVRVFGGEFAAGARATGGWEVTAVLPIPATAT
ncbi:sensor histidine kinase [uncultured Jatrophihabitans sp.]|uniref:sensor histidine kinase n=1 Tax=uncultured Jatrophihabitans sp. TaxID=1610747 RepID=UPI0035CBFA72